jgi:hypothetical protein
MQRSISLFGYGVLRITGLTFAQTVTTNGGTTNTVPKFSGNTTLVNSVITESNGNVGIGTTSPQDPLHVDGSDTNHVGIRVSNEAATGSYPYMIFQQAGSTSAVPGWNNAGAIEATSIGGMVLSAYQGPMIFQTNSRSTQMTITSSGNVGIGTTAPGAKLEINGNIKLSSGSGASLTFPDGTVQSTAWSGTLCGGDYAESVNAVGGKTSYEPGDVLVIGEGTAADVTKSTEPYSVLVAGIYSTKPGLVGRRQTGEGRDAEIPMAMVGIVPAKVSAENGPIKKGDLLVTSSTLGYAMKGTDPSRMLGAVVGKALGSVDSGTGVIEVLVTLQ